MLFAEPLRLHRRHVVVHHISCCPPCTTPHELDETVKPKGNQGDARGNPPSADRHGNLNGHPSDRKELKVYAPAEQVGAIT
jgi:hypothetical protein